MCMFNKEKENQKKGKRKPKTKTKNQNQKPKRKRKRKGGKISFIPSTVRPNSPNATVIVVVIMLNDQTYLIINNK